MSYKIINLKTNKKKQTQKWKPNVLFHPPVPQSRSTLLTTKL